MAQQQGRGQGQQEQQQPRKPPIVLDVPDPKKSGAVWRSNVRIELYVDGGPLLEAKAVIIEVSQRVSRVVTDARTGMFNGWLDFDQPGGYTVTAYREDDPAIRATVHVFISEETAEGKQLREAEGKAKLAESDLKIAEADYKAADFAEKTKGLVEPPEAKATRSAEFRAKAAKADFEAAEFGEKTRQLPEPPEAQTAHVAELRLKQAQTEQQIAELERQRPEVVFDIDIDQTEDPTRPGEWTLSIAVHEVGKQEWTHGAVIIRLTDGRMRRLINGRTERESHYEFTTDPNGTVTLRYTVPEIRAFRRVKLFLPGRRLRQDVERDLSGPPSTPKKPLPPLVANASWRQRFVHGFRGGKFGKPVIPVVPAVGGPVPVGPAPQTGRFWVWAFFIALFLLFSVGLYLFLG